MEERGRLRMHGAMPPLPQYVFMAWCLVKHMDNFTVTFTFLRKVTFSHYKSLYYEFILHSSAITEYYRVIESRRIWAGNVARIWCCEVHEGKGKVFSVLFFN
jgi:hypothetical protein